MTGIPETFFSTPRVTDPDMMHAGITNQWFRLKSVVGETFPASMAHAQPAILRIW